MSKKELNNIWLVQDKLPDAAPMYFAGLVTDRVGHSASRFEPLSEKTKTYKNKRGAEAAVRIANNHYESPFISAVFVEHVEFEVSETAPAASTTETAKPPQVEQPAQPPALSPVPEAERKGWVTLWNVCGHPPLMLRKKVGQVFRYAIAYSDKDVRYLPADEIYAWSRFCDECKAFIVNKIRNRRIAEGKDPDGADEWKRGAES